MLVYAQCLTDGQSSCTFNTTWISNNKRADKNVDLYHHYIDERAPATSFHAPGSSHQAPVTSHQAPAISQQQVVVSPEHPAFQTC